MLGRVGVSAPAHDNIGVTVEATRVVCMLFLCVRSLSEKVHIFRRFGFTNARLLCIHESRECRVDGQNHSFSSFHFAVLFAVPQYSPYSELY